MAAKFTTKIARANRRRGGQSTVVQCLGLALSGINNARVLTRQTGSLMTLSHTSASHHGRIKKCGVFGLRSAYRLDWNLAMGAR